MGIIFKKYDIVLSNSNKSKGKELIVYKISNLGVHAKYFNGSIFMHEIFRIEKTNPLHSGIEEITLTGKKSQ